LGPNIEIKEANSIVGTQNSNPTSKKGIAAQNAPPSDLGLACTILALFSKEDIQPFLFIPYLLNYGPSSEPLTQAYKYKYLYPAR
jgi:hypothetical protein